VKSHFGSFVDLHNISGQWPSEEKPNPRFPPTEKILSLPSTCNAGGKKDSLSSATADGLNPNTIMKVSKERKTFLIPLT
jgi:hypothetical protein